MLKQKESTEAFFIEVVSPFAYTQKQIPASNKTTANLNEIYHLPLHISGSIYLYATGSCMFIPLIFRRPGGKKYQKKWRPDTEHFTGSIDTYIEWILVSVQRKPLLFFWLLLWYIAENVLR